MNRVLLLVMLVLQCVSAIGQEFRPFPQARITTAQWQTYFDDVKSKYGGTARTAPNQPLLVLDDGTSTMYAFTQAGHAAHPAWIARRVVEKSGKIYVDQVGFFAGDEASFAALFQAYKSLDGKVRESVTGDLQGTPK
jgi:hypothetical protein